jgi:hypothetical protein
MKFRHGALKTYVLRFRTYTQRKQLRWAPANPRNRHERRAKVKLERVNQCQSSLNKSQ